MSFDSDILDYGYSYEDIANNMSDISKGEVEIAYISEKDSLKEKVVELEINGKKVTVKLNKDTSSFDENIVYLINQELKKDNCDKIFYYSYMDYEEDFGIVNIAYSTEDDIDKLNKVLKSSDLDMEQFKNEVSTKSMQINVNNKCNLDKKHDEIWNKS